METSNNATADDVLQKVSAYIKGGGTACYLCGANIEGDSFDVAEGTATQEMHCLECEGKWVDLYSLVGIHTGREEIRLQTDGHRVIERLRDELNRVLAVMKAFRMPIGEQDRVEAAIRIAEVALYGK